MFIGDLAPKRSPNRRGREAEEQGAGGKKILNPQYPVPNTQSPVPFVLHNLFSLHSWLLNYKF
ncbi:MAG TPA: hypothetical protein VE956_22160 [Nodularia sp. (in: cyanobacteria)]|nr:hypothetical protein [Nodularia sp. (in: cyanobacteria)]